jgi:hypothetical protein
MLAAKPSYNPLRYKRLNRANPALRLLFRRADGARPPRRMAFYRRNLRHLRID